MKRTRGNLNVYLAPIVSDFLRVGMWPITRVRRRIDPETGIMKSIYRYGKGESAGVIVVDGELREIDRGTFLIISSLDEKTGYEGINGNMVTLGEIKGLKNPRQASAINPTWVSVERLLDANVRIKPNRLGGSLSAGFRLVTGWVDSDGSFFLTTGDYHRMIKSLGLYEYNVVLPKYFRQRSPVLRSLKVFLEPQQDIYSEKGYHISLKKLCTYIGYNYEDREWKDLWRYVEKAMDRLKEVEFLYKKSDRDKTYMSNEGGVISFWARKQYED
jgi:hypothetical protein